MSKPTIVQMPIRLCPHCGAMAVAREGVPPWRYVQCSGCSCRTSDHADIAEAIAVWNRRV